MTRVCVGYGGVLDIATKLRAGRAGVRIPVGGGFLLSRHIHTGSGAPALPLPQWVLGFLRGGKAAGA
jgi:hypothetical protein